MCAQEIINRIKNYKTNALLMAIALVYFFGSSSCMNEKPNDAQFAAIKLSELDRENKSISDNDFDAQFLELAADFNRENIILGQLAQERGNMIYAQDLGTLIVNEHTNSFNNLAALAKSKFVTIPTSLTQKGRAIYKNLNGQSGEDFGSIYSNHLVDAHSDMIAIFEAASYKSSDPLIRELAVATLPALRACLAIAVECQKEFEQNF
jgi:putative membrane protein